VRSERWGADNLPAVSFRDPDKLAVIERRRDFGMARYLLEKGAGAAGMQRNNTRPVLAPVLFQACLNRWRSDSVFTGIQRALREYCRAGADAQAR
jgi:hypothetical protein